MLEFKPGNSASQTAAHIDRAWGEEPTSDCTVRIWFQKFRCSDESFEDEESIEESRGLDNEQRKESVEEDPREDVRELSHAPGFSPKLSAQD